MDENSNPIFQTISTANIEQFYDLVRKRQAYEKAVDDFLTISVNGDFKAAAAVSKLSSHELLAYFLDAAGTALESYKLLNMGAGA
jgi:hypothetical protein